MVHKGFATTCTCCTVILSIQIDQDRSGTNFKVSEKKKKKTVQRFF